MALFHSQTQCHMINSVIFIEPRYFLQNKRDEDRTWTDHPNKFYTNLPVWTLMYGKCSKISNTSYRTGIDKQSSLRSDCFFTVWSWSSLFAIFTQGFSEAWFRAKYLPSSQFKNEQKLPKMVYIIPNFLVIHFGENLLKIRNKNSKITDAWKSV